MLRFAFFSTLVVLFFTSAVSGVCQSIPGCYRAAFPGIAPCKPTGPAPISRTVRMDVPVPCAPVGCRPPMPYPPHRCAPSCCAPPPPPLPIRVRVEVVVRSEKPMPCGPKRCCYGNPPIFKPFFGRAAEMIRSGFIAPLGLGKSLMGHPVPVCPPRFRCPVPVPACGPVLHPRLGYVSKCAPRTAYGVAPRPVPDRFAPAGPGDGALQSSGHVRPRRCPPISPIPR